MDRTTDATGGGHREVVPTSAGPGVDRERVEFGGGIQPGGGMVEPTEFDDAVEEPALPNDALAEGMSARRAARAEGGTVDPAASPSDNETGDRMGDVGGYLGSDEVVGIDASVEGKTKPGDRRSGG